MRKTFRKVFFPEKYLKERQNSLIFPNVFFSVSIRESIVVKRMESKELPDYACIYAKGLVPSASVCCSAGGCRKLACGFHIKLISVPITLVIVELSCVESVCHELPGGCELCSILLPYFPLCGLL